MAALDLFGRRWHLRILWELREGPLGFRVLQQRCDGMSSSVLRQRLTEMLAVHLVVQHQDKAYELTDLGYGAFQALRPLGRWADKWAAVTGEENAGGGVAGMDRRSEA